MDSLIPEQASYLDTLDSYLDLNGYLHAEACFMSFCDKCGVGKPFLQPALVARGEVRQWCQFCIGLAQLRIRGFRTASATERTQLIPSMPVSAWGSAQQ